MAKISIGDREFPTKKAALVFCKDFLAAADLTVQDLRGVTRLTGEDEALARSLWRMHYAYDAAVEQPVGFGIRQDPAWGSYSRQFVRLLPDGDVQPYSYKQCISPTGDVSSVLKAFRRLVEPQMAHERQKLPSMVTCGLSGRVVPRGEIDLDHADIEFAELVDAFLAARGIPYAAVRIGKDNLPTGQKLSVPFLQLHALLIREGGLMPIARDEHWRKPKTFRVRRAA